VTDDTLQRVIATLADMEKHDLPIDVNLLEAGELDSLNFLELVERLEEAFGIELDLGAQDPDRLMRLAGLAAVIDETRRDALPSAGDGALREVNDPAAGPAIRRAGPHDLQALCHLAMRAYETDPLLRWLYPDDTEYFTDNGRVLRHSMRRWLAWHETYVLDNVAMAAWIPPGRPTVLVPREPEDGPLPPERLGLYRALDSSLAERTPAEPHWYLNMLATDPDHQRQGLGRRLLKEMLARARDEGLGTYLETATIENVRFYEHAGFLVREEWDLPLDGPHLWGMWHSA
jgi:GNAT superfamily N-acetyltransferase